MQFGIFDHIEGIAGTSMHQLLRDRIELVKMADAAGFVGYHLAEHTAPICASLRTRRSSSPPLPKRRSRSGSARS